MTTPFDLVIRRFAWFLDVAWGAASEVARTMEHVESGELTSDWLQANWELLVETPFRDLSGFGNTYLEPYGEGADCNDASSRVWNPGALPTHRVVCRASGHTAMLDLLTGRRVDAVKSPVAFDHFAIKTQDGWHAQGPPFDCVLG